MVNEVSRILRPGGLFLAGEWGRCAAMEGSLDPEILTPHACGFYNAVSENRGLTPIASYLQDLIESSDCFSLVEAKRFTIPVGTWPSDPRMQDLGGQCRNYLVSYANSMRVMMVQAGRDAEEVGQLVDGYVNEMFTVPGMICYFYTVQANRSSPT